jgi:hypothetical protein
MFLRKGHVVAAQSRALPSFTGAPAFVVFVGVLLLVAGLLPGPWP